MRAYYLYNRELIKELAGDGWEIVYDDTQYVLEQDWFTLALKKI